MFSKTNRNNFAVKYSDHKNTSVKKIMINFGRYDFHVAFLYVYQTIIEKLLKENMFRLP